MKEEWRDIEGYEGYYQVSNMGRVQGLDRIDSAGHRVRGKMLSPNTNKGAEGYRIIGLSRNNQTKFYLVHRLVAIAFIPNPNNLPEVNHEDETLQNNCADNLEWCTRLYNANYGSIKERVASHFIKPIIGTSLKTGEKIRFKSGLEARKAGFSNDCISRCISGRIKTSRGYTWEFAS